MSEEAGVEKEVGTARGRPFRVVRESARPEDEMLGTLDRVRRLWDLRGIDATSGLLLEEEP